MTEAGRAPRAWPSDIRLPLQTGGAALRNLVRGALWLFPVLALMVGTAGGLVALTFWQPVIGMQVAVHCLVWGSILFGVPAVALVRRSLNYLPRAVRLRASDLVL